MSTINVTNLKGRGGATPNLPDGANITGVATASGGFSGTLTGTGLTTGSDGSINVTSIKTVGVSTLGNVVITGAVGGGATVGAYAGVTTFYGDGSSLTGVGESIAPWNYNPDVNDSTVTIATGIGITFNKKVVAGSGTATLKIVNAGAAGTTIQSWGVSSCTFGITDFTLGSLVSNLTEHQTYQVDIPSGFILDGAGASYAGTAYTFATGLANYTLWSWGANISGRLGLNQSSSPAAKVSSPTQIPGTTWNIGYGVYGFNNNSLVAPTSDGTLFAWGVGTKGVLGQNDRTSRSSPIQISGTTWAPYGNSQTAYSALCTKTDGTLWGWGANEFGMLGLNQSGGGAFISSPTQIGSETTWPKDGIDGKMAAGGELMHFAIKTDGTLWGMGWNSMGQLGQNSTVGRSSPVQIPGTTWSHIQCGEQSIKAVKTDGTAWAWGGNEQGELGQNAAGVEQSSPVQIPGTNWSKAFSVNKASYGVKTDGTMWAWGGQNSYGILGLNQQNVSISSPTQIPGTTWKQISGGEESVNAVKTDGTLWGWGRGENGRHGLPNENNYSSPVQVGSETDWDRTIAGHEGGFAIRKS